MPAFATGGVQLKPWGTVWLNLGDSYWGGKGTSNYAFQERRLSSTLAGAQHNITPLRVQMKEEYRARREGTVKEQLRALMQGNPNFCDGYRGTRKRRTQWRRQMTCGEYLLRTVPMKEVGV